MNIIVESGATKSEWMVFDGEGTLLKSILLPGMNVSSMGMEEVRRIISRAFSELGVSRVETLSVYTAGVLTDAIREELSSYMRSLSDIGHVDIQNDLVGAARSLFGDSSGIVAILGTGSNSCFYDGEKVSQAVYSGGFIIGDDGSASVLGKMFLSDYIKKQVPNALAAEFAAEFDASYRGIVAGVYKSPSPAKYLGSIAPFLIPRYDRDEYVRRLVDSNFRSFINRSLSCYDTSSFPVGIVGGFGYACRDILVPLLSESGITDVSFLEKPIEGLARYHKSSFLRNPAMRLTLSARRV